MKLQIMIVLGTMYLFSCKAQQSKTTCELNYEKAETEIGNYSKSSNTDYLKAAQLFLDSSLYCNETRKKSIQRKIQVFYLQKVFKEGAMFVDTLKNSDFEFEYEKQMYKNDLAGLGYAEINDIKKRDSAFNVSITNIQYYIDKNKYTKFSADTVAFYSLYYTKSKIFDTIRISNEINVLKQKFPKDKAAIDRMKEIIIESMIH